MKVITTAYLLLGTNIGAREDNLLHAQNLLQRDAGDIMQLSSIYETEAWGIKAQAAFLNQAVELHTALSPQELLQACKNIEQEVGRTETEKWGPRVIDIDILFFGNEIVNSSELQVPHPFLHERKFTLAPLNEIASDYLHPSLQKTIAALLRECSDTSAVNILAYYINTLTP